MNKTDFISEIKSRGGVLLPTASDRAVELAQNALQQMRAAMIPMDFIDVFRHDAGGIALGDANIFGPAEYERPKYSIPSLVQVNRELANIPNMRGRTIFGRNGLFWFGFDAFGMCYMLDNLTLNPMRKYDNAYRAMMDCLVVGKI